MSKKKKIWLGVLGLALICTLVLVFIFIRQKNNTIEETQAETETHIGPSDGKKKETKEETYKEVESNPTPQSNEEVLEARESTKTDDGKEVKVSQKLPDGEHTINLNAAGIAHKDLDKYLIDEYSYIYERLINNKIARLKGVGAMSYLRVGNEELYLSPESMLRKKVDGKVYQRDMENHEWKLFTYRKFDFGKPISKDQAIQEINFLRGSEGFTLDFEYVETQYKIYKLLHSLNLPLDEFLLSHIDSAYFNMTPEDNGIGIITINEEQFVFIVKEGQATYTALTADDFRQLSTEIFTKLDYVTPTLWRSIKKGEWPVKEKEPEVMGPKLVD